MCVNGLFFSFCFCFVLFILSLLRIHDVVMMILLYCNICIDQILNVCANWIKKIQLFYRRTAHRMQLNYTTYYNQHSNIIYMCCIFWAIHYTCIIFLWENFENKKDIRVHDKLKYTSTNEYWINKNTAREEAKKKKVKNKRNKERSSSIVCDAKRFVCDEELRWKSENNCKRKGQFRNNIQYTCVSLHETKFVCENRCLLFNLNNNTSNTNNSYKLQRNPSNWNCVVCIYRGDITTIHHGNGMDHGHR